MSEEARLGQDGHNPVEHTHTKRQRCSASEKDVRPELASDAVAGAGRASVAVPRKDLGLREVRPEATRISKRADRRDAPPSDVSDAAPCTPQRHADNSFQRDVSPVKVAFRRVPNDAWCNLSFDSVEDFKNWLQSSKGSASRSGRFLPRRSSWDLSPGWGLITGLSIEEPKMYLNGDIGSVIWVHWGDGSVRVDTMSDPTPTPWRHGTEERLDKLARLQAFRRIKLQLALAGPNLSRKHSLPNDVWPRIVRYVIPSSLLS